MTYLSRPEPPRQTYQRVRLRLQVEAEGIAQTADEAFRAEGITTEAQEVLLVAALDSAGHVRAVAEVARGAYNVTVAHLPALLAVSLLAGCDRISIAHNHPSGELTASDHDLELTRIIVRGANAAGITLDDHLIYVPRGDALSLKAERMLTAPGPRPVKVQGGAT